MKSCPDRIRENKAEFQINYKTHSVSKYDDIAAVNWDLTTVIKEAAEKIMKQDAHEENI